MTSRTSDKVCTSPSQEKDGRKRTKRILSLALRNNFSFYLIQKSTRNKVTYYIRWDAFCCKQQKTQLKGKKIFKWGKFSTYKFWGRTFQYWFSGSVLPDTQIISILGALPPLDYLIFAPRLLPDGYKMVQLLTLGSLIYTTMTKG